MPLSYQSFGFTTILLMVTVLVAAQLFRYVRERLRRPDHQEE